MLHVADFSSPCVSLQDNCEARAQAAALLPGGSLEPVVAAVERCLHFYITAGQSRLVVCLPCLPSLVLLPCGRQPCLPHPNSGIPFASRSLCLQAP